MEIHREHDKFSTAVIDHIGLVNMDKVVVGQPIADLRFLQSRINGHARAQDLHRELPVQGGIPRQPDFTEAAGADEVEQLILVQLQAGREGQWLCGTHGWRAPTTRH